MAIMRTIHCKKCGETQEELRADGDYEEICGECRKKAASGAREQFLAERAALPIEERIRLIEAWIYDYKPPKSIVSTLF